ncbi:MAG TPA: hypothetical protein H9840_09185, partial [Candidatus Anaerofilum excrementigallinarum]|nr:hypothetical protein [Candidatus Anaerofilum excrementigallinarum]
KIVCLQSIFPVPVRKIGTAGAGKYAVCSKLMCLGKLPMQNALSEASFCTPKKRLAARGYGNGMR